MSVSRVRKQVCGARPVADRLALLKGRLGINLVLTDTGRRMRGASAVASTRSPSPMPIRRARRRRDGAHPLTPPLNPAAARESSFSGRWSVAPAQRLRRRRRGPCDVGSMAGEAPRTGRERATPPRPQARSLTAGAGRSCGYPCRTGAPRGLECLGGLEEPGVRRRLMRGPAVSEYTSISLTASVRATLMRWTRLRPPACRSTARTTSGARQVRLKLRSLIQQMGTRGTSLGRIRRDRTSCVKILRDMRLKAHSPPDSERSEMGCGRNG